MKKSYRAVKHFTAGTIQYVESHITYDVRYDIQVCSCLLQRAAANFSVSNNFS